MLYKNNFNFFNFMFSFKKLPLPNGVLTLSNESSESTSLRFYKKNFYFIKGDFDQLIYKKNILLPLFSYLKFISTYYSGLFFGANYHLLGLTFSMGISKLDNTNNFGKFSFIVRMNQAHYSLFRFPSSFIKCLVEKKGWIMRMACRNRTDFYYITKRLHALRSLFPYKIKGFLFFSELPYQEKNIYSGKQERKPSGGDKGKGGAGGKGKKKSSEKEVKGKRGRNI